MHGVYRPQEFPQSNERWYGSPRCVEKVSAARWPQAERRAPRRRKALLAVGERRAERHVLEVRRAEVALPEERLGQRREAAARERGLPAAPQ